MADATAQQAQSSDEELSAEVPGSFLGTDRTYGARLVWHDMPIER